ncbi:unnamed protein product [Musa textilis]
MRASYSIPASDPATTIGTGFFTLPFLVCPAARLPPPSVPPSPLPPLSPLGPRASPETHMGSWQGWRRRRRGESIRSRSRRPGAAYAEAITVHYAAQDLDAFIRQCKA